MITKIPIAIIAYNDKTSKAMALQLASVIGECFSFKSYSLQAGLPELIDARLVLISTQTYTGKVARLTPVGVDILIIQKTLSKSSWEILMEIPPRSKLLLVNDYRDSAVEAVSLLYELGAKHLELIPYYHGHKYIPQGVELAVTPGETDLVPSGIKKVYDLGDRVIDASTIYDILSRFNLLQNESMSSAVSAYMETIIPRNKVLRTTLDKLGDIKQQLEDTLYIVNDGIISCDEKDIITVFNDKAEQFTRKKAWEVVGYKLGDCFPLLDNKGKQSESIDNLLITIGGRHFVVNKKTLTKKGMPTGMVLTLKDVTEAQHLERSLRQELKTKGHVAKYTFEDILGNSAETTRVKNICRRVATNSKIVILQGESGSGKELYAHAIHNASDRSRASFVAVNCSALPENLLESELFGYEEGAFTGAKKGGKLGFFEQAHTGTIFLDEIGDMSLPLQGRLLRVLQENEILKVGGTRVIPVDVRVITATHRNLEEMLEKGNFREDLFYRLNVFPIKVPSLRERKEDIPVLAQHFLSRLRPGATLPPEIIDFFMDYPWRGNVRELENTVEYLVTMGDEALSIKHLPDRLLKNRGVKTEEISAEAPLDRNELLVLMLLYKTEQKGHNVGRRFIVSETEHNGFRLTEHSVKTIFKKLEHRGLIKVTKGRGGSKLTSKGKEYITAQHLESLALSSLKEL